MSTPAACLLFSQFVPASARLLVEYRRLRGSLPRAEERKAAACGADADILPHAQMMSVVCLCVHRTSRAPTAIVRHKARICCDTGPAPQYTLSNQALAVHNSVCMRQHMLQAMSRGSGGCFLFEAVSCLAQTISEMEMIGVHLTVEQRRDPDVHDAKKEGMMCPALVELVCEALGCSGRAPDGAGMSLTAAMCRHPFADRCSQPQTLQSSMVVRKR